MAREAPIRFIDFERFKKLSEFPRFPQNAHSCTSMVTIDRENSFIIFISHCWIRGHARTEGYDGRPHPDNAFHDKFKLCVSGIEKLKSTHAPSMTNCYVWLDFGCLNQDGNPTIEMGDRFKDLIGFCDCLFSPIHGSNKNTSSTVSTFYDDYNVESWNGEYGYVQKAWCRLEMFYAANIPTCLNTAARLSKFRNGLLHHATRNVRPHFLYGTTEMKDGSQPTTLPPLQNSYFDKLNPSKGLLTNETDRPEIERLVDLLKPHMKVVEEGYSGERNATGQMHGRGVYNFPGGSVYDGEWRNGSRHGRGIYTSANGDTYEGGYQNDKQHGQGVYKYADGSTYDGQWQNGNFHGRGAYKDASGDIYEGEFKDNKKHGRGVFKSVHGDIYEGEFKFGVMDGSGVYKYPGGEEYNGQYQNGLMHGRGVYKYASGSVYDGEYQNDKKHGRGVYRYHDGDVYDGEWKEGKKEGKGIYKNGKGQIVHDGDWKNDKEVKVSIGRFKNTFDPSQDSTTLSEGDKTPAHTSKKSNQDVNDELVQRTLRAESDFNGTSKLSISLSDFLRNIVGKTKNEVLLMCQEYCQPDFDSDMATIFVNFLALSDDLAIVEHKKIEAIRKDILKFYQGSSVTEMLLKLRTHVYEENLKEAKLAGALPFRRSRLMIVGEGAAGKSSFLRALSKRVFVSEHNSTVGVQVEELTTLRDAGVNTADLNWSTLATMNEVDRAVQRKAISDSLTKMARNRNQVEGQPNQGSEYVDQTFFANAKQELDDMIDKYDQIESRENLSTSLTAEEVTIENKVEAAAMLDSLTFTQNANSITFSCWDFGGQRVFQTVQHILLSRSGVYAVVFDMRKLIVGTQIGNLLVTDNTKESCLSYIEFWLRQIHLQALGAPIYLIGTHLDQLSDLLKHQQISQILLSRFVTYSVWKHVVVNDELAFFPVSNMSTSANENILQTLRTNFNDSAQSDPLKYVDKEVPISWLRVCDQLSDLVRQGISYINREAIIEKHKSTSIMSIAQACGVFSGLLTLHEKHERMDAMLSFFHDLGILSFYDKCGFKDIVILDPQWLVDMIVCVIRDFTMHPLERDKTFKRERHGIRWKSLVNNGVAAASMLDSFWREEEGKISFLISLMTELSLMCQLPNADPSRLEHQYLIPSILLTEDRSVTQCISSDNIQSIETSCQTNFQITFPSCNLNPETFLSRLIVLLVSSCDRYTSLQINSTFKLVSPSVSLGPTGSLCASIVLNGFVFLSQTNDSIEVSLFSDQSSEIQRTYEILTDSCDVISKKFFNSIKVQILDPEVRNVSKSVEVVVLDSIEADTDIESISSGEDLKSVDDGHDKESCLAALRKWLADDVGILTSDKQNGIAKALYNDGWYTVADMTDMMSRGYLTKQVIDQLTTSTGDRAKIYEALKTKVENQKRSQPVQSSPNTSQKHVMVSYNWAQKDIAKKLTERLRSESHDIWRDEDGSRILGRLSSFPTTLAGMAAAVEHSQYCIVCVSQEYSLSVNCMREFDYMAVKKDKHCLVFIMTQESFLPPNISGPLGIIIGNAVYIKLRDANDFESACNEVSTRISTPLLADARSMLSNTVGSSSQPNSAKSIEFVKMSGFIEKRSQYLMKWDLRFAKLQGCNLSFSHTEASKVTVSVQVVSVEHTPSNTVLVKGNKDERIFLRSSEETMRAWVEAVQTNIDRLK